MFLTQVNDLAYTGTSALHLACNNGFLEIIKCLLEHGADVNMQVMRYRVSGIIFKYAGIIVMFL